MSITTTIRCSSHDGLSLNHKTSLSPVFCTRDVILALNYFHDASSSGIYADALQHKPLSSQSSIALPNEYFSPPRHITSQPTNLARSTLASLAHKLYSLILAMSPACRSLHPVHHPQTFFLAPRTWL